MNQPSDEIKDRLDIVDVVQDYIQLKKAGANYKACCPFHNEKTPSFMVSQDKQIWHCFGCGKGGDIFSFVQEMEGVDFVEALKSLAQKAGIQLKKQNPQLLQQKEKLADILELAAEFFHTALLRSKAGETARKYLTERGIKDETVSEFKLGYTPDLWDALLNFLTKRHFTVQDMLSAGLIIKRESREGYYDRFRHRLMFPISDVSGKVVGFGGRVMPGEKEKEMAKYINTPQTQKYDKSRILYGLDKAKTEIRQNDMAVVVEGYMDVISSHQAGIKNVVASSGTALTQDQINLIKRYTANLVLAFDMDVAGDTAAKRGIDLALASEMNVKIARLPQGMDPDDAVRSDVKIWQEAIENAQNVMDYYFDSTLQKLDLKKVEDKKQATAILIPVISKIYNDVEKAHYIQKLATTLNIEERVLYDVMKKFQSGKPKILEKSQDKSTKENIDSREALSMQLLSYLFNFPEMIANKLDKLNPEFLHHKYQNLYNILYTYYNNKGKEFDYSEFTGTIRKEDPETADIADVVELYLQKDNLISEIGQKEASSDIDWIINTLKQKFLKDKLANLQIKLQVAENNNNKKELEKLSAEFNQLFEQLSKLNL